MKGLEDKQGIIFRDSDRDKVIVALEAEIERVQAELEKEVEDDGEKNQ